MMNDEFYDSHENIREAWHQQLSQDDSYRSGLRFARRIRLARIVGLAAIFVPLASVLVSQFLFRRLVVIAGGLGLCLAPTGLAAGFSFRLPAFW